MQAQPLILGLGKTALSLIAHFVRQGQTPMLVDTRITPPQLQQLQKDFPGMDCLLADDFTPCKQYIADAWASPGFPLAHPLLDKLRAQAIPIRNDIELFVGRLKTVNPQAQLIAITGTNGKSTVCSMLSHLLASAGTKLVLAGNIGVPVADILCRPLDAQVYILELSSFQLVYVDSLSQHIACILNIAADHLDHHSSMEAYAAAKQRIYSNSAAQVCNSDDPATFPNKQDHSSHRYWFGSAHSHSNKKRESIALVENGHLCFGGKKLLEVAAVPNPTDHNLTNALAVIALLASIDRLDAIQHLSSYSYLPHRCQQLGKKQDRWFVNDSKATNPHAAINAIESLARGYSGLVVIGGGDAKGVELMQLGSKLRDYCRALVVIGKDGKRLAEQATGIAIREAKDMQQAVTLALALSEEDDCIALCPGCSSTDMFKNYEERGNEFVNCVEGL